MAEGWLRRDWLIAGEHIFCANCLYPPPLDEGGQVPQCPSCEEDKLDIVELGVDSFEAAGLGHLLASPPILRDKVNDHYKNLGQSIEQWAEAVRWQNSIVSHYMTLTWVVAEARGCVIGS